MRNAWIITVRELKAYFNSPVAYVLISAYLIVSGYFFAANLFLVNEATLRPFFNTAPFLLLVLAPAITMRLLAEEKKLGTLEILMTMAVKDWEVVLGKYLAALIFIAAMLVGTIVIPITLVLLGDPDVGPMIGGYLAMLLMAGSFLSIGLFASSVTSNQVVALIIGFSISLMLLLVGQAAQISSGFLANLLAFLSIGEHFGSVARGVIDTRDLIYYISLIVFFLSLTGYTLSSRRWR